MNGTQFSLATEGDLSAIQAWLADCRLPTDGIERLTANCIVAKADAKLVGTIALEPCGASALLRSLAVAPEYRVRSLGRNLCARMISHARMLGVERLYLLTTDAEQYFAALGFQRASGARRQRRSGRPASSVPCVRRMRTASTRRSRA